MRKTWFVSAVLLILVMLLTSVASAQSLPRAIPSNDNFANAKPIVVGKNYGILDIEGATVEPGQPTITSCGGVTTIYHSVWFSIYLPNYATIHLSTEGTHFTSEFMDSIDTVIAVFTGPSLPALVQIACNDGAGTMASELDAFISANVASYVMVGSSSYQLLDPASVLKLNTRMKHSEIIVPNRSFEQPLMPTDWKVKNSTGDGRLCNDPSYPPWAGSCVFRFVGNVGEDSKFKQTVVFPSYFVPRKNGVMTFTFVYRVMDAAIGRAKAKFRVNYSDGTPADTAVVDFTGLAPMGGNDFGVRVLYLKSRKVASIYFEVSFKSTTGTLLIDNAWSAYSATASTRDAVLSLPLAAAK